MSSTTETRTLVDAIVDNADERELSIIRRAFTSLSPTVIERFWEMVGRCSHGPDCHACCWLWHGGTSKGGYGSLTISTLPPKVVRANRFCWLVTHGLIPEGMSVLHNCPAGDDPRCVNPHHLWIGTQRENIADAQQKQRLSTGDKHYTRTHPERMARGVAFPNARLNDEQVLDIRYLYAKGMRQKLLGTIYEVSFQTISRVVRGDLWTHLPLTVEVR